MQTVDLSPFRAAIFDFDETMIDLEAQHHAATRALCESFGSDYESLPYEFRFSSGMRIVDEIQTMRRTFGWSDSLEALAEKRTRLMLDEVRRAPLVWLPGVEQTVEALRANDLRLGIASSGTREYIEEILTRLGLRDAFAVIVSGEQVTHAKPDPEAYLKAARALEVEPARCCVFEDSAVGVRAAKDAGMYCIAVRNQNAKTAQDLSPADVIVDALSELRLALPGSGGVAG